MVVSGDGLSRVAAACGDDDPAAVGIGDVVEAKKVPRTPTNQRASDLIDHGLDLDVTRRERRGNKKKESVADFLGLEVSGGPRSEFGHREGPSLTEGHENVLWGGNYNPGYHAPKNGGGIGAGCRVTQIGEDMDRRRQRTRMPRKPLRQEQVPRLQS